MSKIAYIFPGQGSQSVGMLAGHETGREIIDSALAETSEALGYDMAALINDGPAERLDQTEFTQPAILAASIAIWRIHQSQGKSCDYVAGHSLGEYSALVAAGAMDFASALRLVRARGQLMQEAVPAGTGKMAAVIGADLEALESVCQEASVASGCASIANFNSRKQVVISGTSEGVDAVLAKAEGFGAKRTVVLPVTVPSHCALMQPAAERFAERLGEVDIRPPDVPILPNVDPQPTTDPAVIRDSLVRQLSSSVQWVRTIETLSKELGVEEFVECGPGRVLAGLLRQIL